MGHRSDSTDDAAPSSPDALALDPASIERPTHDVSTSDTAPGAPPEASASASTSPSTPTPLPATSPEVSSRRAVRAGGAKATYRESVAGLAQRIVDAQRPVRVLASLRWPAAIEDTFRKSRFREPPAVDPEAYEEPLGYETRAKVDEFDAIAKDVEAELGANDPIGRILLRTSTDYADVVRMLAARGTAEFYTLSRRLYGSPKECFPGTALTSAAGSRALAPLLSQAAAVPFAPVDERTLSAAEAADVLGERFKGYFAGASVQVQLDDSIAADAAAGTDYVKLRGGAMFSMRDVDILEVHEGWVHVATSLNGQSQAVAKWLGKGPPRTTAAQEGLAVLTEVLTFRVTPERARRLNNRVLAVDMAEDGASFVDVFAWFRAEGYDEKESFNNTRRVFRGGLPGGGAPFTKDACYAHGLLLNFAFVRAALRHGRPELVPFLFVGKVTHEDVTVLFDYVSEGLVTLPTYVPKVFQDLRGLAILLAYTDFVGGLGGEGLAAYYGGLLRLARDASAGPRVSGSGGDDERDGDVRGVLGRVSPRSA